VIPRGQSAGAIGTEDTMVNSIRQSPNQRFTGGYYTLLIVGMNKVQ
jgi:hypothetical protein